MDVQFAMIVYVNRSGSTLLSRLLSDHFEDAFVFPELSFILHLLIERSRGRFVEGEALFEVLVADPRIDALGLDMERLQAICGRSNSRDLPTFFVNLATAAGGGAPPRAILFKFEVLLYLYEDVVRAFPGLKTIHLVRDPRAVVRSMLSSALPEKPGFNMARNSLVFAARQWRDYVRRASKVGRTHPLLMVRFESIGTEPETVFKALSDFLGLPVTTGSDPLRRYRISELDSALHAHVFEPFIGHRATAWNEELAERSIAIIEAICRSEMRLVGYEATVQEPSRRTMAGAYVGHLYRMLDHNVRTLAIYAKRKDRVQALSKRAKVFVRKMGWTSAS